jgi:predicted RNA methylase
MLTDHNRMAAYHAAIVGNADVFKDKVVMDVGTGSGILAGESRRLNFVGHMFFCGWERVFS